jgi:hypothetical protein
VAANTTNPEVVGPIFEDLSFEYIPIYDEHGEEKKTYRDFRARNQRYGQTLADFLPTDVANLLVHYDPDFDNFLYGQPSDKDPRSLVLRKLERGDLLFFVASLAPYDPHVYAKRDELLRSYQVGRRNKYVIGFFTVDGVARVEVFPRDQQSQMRLLEEGKIEVHNISGAVSVEDVKLSNNYKRLKSLGQDCFVLVKGDPNRSALLKRAVKLTERQEGYGFVLNELGRTLLSRSSDSLRGARWIDENAVRLLFKEVERLNPELASKFP